MEFNSTDVFNESQRQSSSPEGLMDADEAVVRHECKVCLKPLDTQPKIKCAECPDMTICVGCFSLGLEIQDHRCDHAYRVESLHLPQDDTTNWTLIEDRDLLQAVLDCGYGNEVDLGRRFLHRNTDEIVQRIDTLLNLDKAALNCRLQDEPPPLIPYDPESLSEHPPRYPQNCAYSKSLAGYNAARGDFTAEYLNNAELALCRLNVNSDEDDSDEELTTAINLAVVECHNEVLRERQRRKDVIKEHALLLRKTCLMNATSSNPELIVFTQLLNRHNHDLLQEGLVLEQMLQNKVKKYQKYRRLGITRLRGIAMHNRLDKMRLESLKNLKTMKNIPLVRSEPSYSNNTKVKAPLDLLSSPGYDALTQDERDLCSNGRILPETYLKAKESFMEVSREEGGLRLKAARKIMKIDVNKTRKIFNFLRDKKLIKDLNT